MPRILITGKNSYVGNMTEQWLKQKEEEFIIDKISMRNDNWKKLDLGVYDSIIHVAGIAHNSSDKKLEDLYYSVNRDLTIELAKKAKEDGAKQFIFLSSIIVYGTKNEVITKDTKPNPDNFYGVSKLQAEEGLLPLSSNDFKIAILRPPMIYGKESKGNFPKLVKLAKLTPIFPDYPNQRSMLHIDMLAELIRLLIVYRETGIYHPQNRDYVNVSGLVYSVGQLINHKIIKIEMLNPLIKSLKNVGLINKVFGNLVYNKTLSQIDFGDYQIYDFLTTLEKSRSDK